MALKVSATTPDSLSSSKFVPKHKNVGVYPRGRVTEHRHTSLQRGVRLHDATDLLKQIDKRIQSRYLVLMNERRSSN
jgi:hypothetical protein